MKLDKVISSGAEFLKNNNIPEPFLNAELLVAHTLGINLSGLYTKMEEELSPEITESYNLLLKRRIKFEPLQYILGYEEFYGRKFVVTREVFIPRPETELLIDIVKKYYDGSENFCLLDIGTGSGNIAITIKKEMPSIKVFATDISPSAIRIARLNAERHGVRDGFFLLSSDLLSALKPADTFDIIVANPPYIPTGRIDSLQPEIKLYEPEEAIDGGIDGLDKIRRIISSAGLYLKKNGRLIIEIDCTQGESVLSLSEKTGQFKNAEIQKDLAGFDRFFIATRK